MAALTTGDRVAIGATLQSDWSSRRMVLGAVTKADIQAAIAAVDAWIDANSASFNTALPAAARNALTAAQKAELLMYVMRQRFIKGV